MIFANPCPSLADDGGPCEPADTPPATLAGFLLAAVRERLCDIRQAAEAYERTAEPEALHDLRVSLRVLRSVLQTLRKLYGRELVDALVDELKAFAARTNRLRDAEVLSQWLRQAKAPDSRDPWLADWLGHHLAEEDRIRRELRTLIQTRPLEPVLARVEALVAGALPPELDGSPGLFAEAAVESRRKRLVRLLRDLPAHIGDDMAVHGARIAAKRVRYIAEFYAPLLAKAHRKYARVARELQGRLGDLHDLDVFLADLLARQAAGAPVPPALMRRLMASRARQAIGMPDLLTGALRRLT